jgi:hypothetical protein
MWRLPNPLDLFIPRYDLGRADDYSGPIHPRATARIARVARKPAPTPIPDDTPPWELPDVANVSGGPGMVALVGECPGCVQDGLCQHIPTSTSAPCDAHLARAWLLQEYRQARAHHGPHTVPLVELGGSFYALHDYASVVSHWARVHLHAWRQRNDRGASEHVVFAVVTPDQARMLARDLPLAGYTVVRRFLPLAPGRTGVDAGQTGVWRRLAGITSVMPLPTAPQVITPLQAQHVAHITSTPWLPTPQPFPHSYPQSWQGEHTA